MELNRELAKALPLDTPQEIDERLRRRYLDRLGQKVKKLRKHLIERNWEELKLECSQLAHSGDTFGFQNLTALAHIAYESIPKGRVHRAFTPLHAKETTEALITAIDKILIEYHVIRI